MIYSSDTTTTPTVPLDDRFEDKMVILSMRDMQKLLDLDQPGFNESTQPQESLLSRVRRLFK